MELEEAKIVAQAPGTGSATYLLCLDDEGFLSEQDWGFRVVSTRLGAKPRQTWAAAISRNLACAYAPEGWLGCPEMARTRLGSGIARDL